MTEENKVLTDTEKVSELKKVIRTSSNLLFWVFMCLLIPTITKYITGYRILGYAVDFGILSSTIMSWIINNRLKKKAKEEEGNKIKEGL